MEMHIKAGHKRRLAYGVLLCCRNTSQRTEEDHPKCPGVQILGVQINDNGYTLHNQWPPLCGNEVTQSLSKITFLLTHISMVEQFPRSQLSGAAFGDSMTLFMTALSATTLRNFAWNERASNVELRPHRRLRACPLGQRALRALV